MRRRTTKASQGSMESTRSITAYERFMNTVKLRKGRKRKAEKAENEKAENEKEYTCDGKGRKRKASVSHVRLV